MRDSLLNPIQAEEQGINIDIRPHCYYPNDPIIQCMIFEGGNRIPIEYNGVLPFIPI